MAPFHEVRRGRCRRCESLADAVGEWKGNVVPEHLWAKDRDKLYIGGQWPQEVPHEVGSRVPSPSINVSKSKTAEQIAKDITRRLLLDYRAGLAQVLQKYADDCDYKGKVAKTKRDVAEILGGRIREHSDIVDGRGSVDIQVTGPDSLRFSGHCLYFTTEQLRRIREAVPELFENGPGR